MLAQNRKKFKPVSAPSIRYDHILHPWNVINEEGIIDGIGVPAQPSTIEIQLKEIRQILSAEGLQHTHCFFWDFVRVCLWVRNRLVTARTVAGIVRPLRPAEGNFDNTLRSSREAVQSCYLVVLSVV